MGLLVAHLCEWMGHLKDIVITYTRGPVELGWKKKLRLDFFGIEVTSSNTRELQEQQLSYKTYLESVHDSDNTNSYDRRAEVTETPWKVYLLITNSAFFHTYFFNMMAWVCKNGKISVLSMSTLWIIVCFQLDKPYEEYPSMRIL